MLLQVSIRRKSQTTSVANEFFQFRMCEQMISQAGLVYEVFGTKRTLVVPYVEMDSLKMINY